MLNSKQRSKLKAMSNDLQPIFQVGKGGLTDNLIKDLSDALDAKELVKITVLKNAEVSGKDIIGELAAALNADAVCAIGNKVVLYRYSEKDRVKHIEF